MAYSTSRTTADDGVPLTVASVLSAAVRVVPGRFSSTRIICYRCQKL